MSDEEIRVPAGLTTEGLLGRRYMARLIDSVVLIFLSVVIGFAGAVALGPAEYMLPAITVSFVGWIAYGAMLESSPWQATVGKRVMGLRVYDAQGKRLGFLQAAGRSLIKDGPFIIFNAVPGGRILSLLWLVAHLVVIHRSPVYQAIHDRAVHTWVAAPEEVTQLRIV